MRARKSASVRSLGKSASEAFGVSMSAMHRVAQNLFEPRAPHVDPDGAHAGDDAVGDDGALIGARVFEDVEADGIGAVGEIDIADLVVARRRHERERFARQSRHADQ